MIGMQSLRSVGDSRYNVWGAVMMMRSFWLHVCDPESLPGKCRPAQALETYPGKISGQIVLIPSVALRTAVIKSARAVFLGK